MLLSPPSSTGRESLSSGHPTSMWSPTVGIRTTGLPLGGSCDLSSARAVDHVIVMRLCLLQDE